MTDSSWLPTTKTQSISPELSSKKTLSAMTVESSLDSLRVSQIKSQESWLRKAMRFTNIYPSAQLKKSCLIYLEEDKKANKL